MARHGGPVPNDHNEYEPMTAETWDQVLDELDAEHPGLKAGMIGRWMEGHRGHTGTKLRWHVPDGSLGWYVHGQCDQCRVASGQHYVIDEDLSNPTPSFLQTLHKRKKEKHG